jgi:hypothetical protein
VVGAGGVIAERDGAQRAEEDRPRGADLRQGGPGVGDQEQEVLGGVALGERECLVEVVRQEYGAGLGQRRLDDRGPGLAAGEAVQGVGGPPGDVVVGGDEHRRGVRVVLRLGDHLAGDDLGVGRGVGDNEQLGRPGQGESIRTRSASCRLASVTNALPGPTMPSAGGMVSVPKRQGGDGTGPARGEHPVGARHSARGQDQWRRTIGARGRADEHLLHAGNPGRDDSHEDAAGVGARHPERRRRPVGAHRVCVPA